MTTFDEHSRDEVFRDYLTEARAAKHYAVEASTTEDCLVPYHIGRGQIHATLAHAAATLLAAMPEVQYQVTPSEVTAERDALRDRVDELVAAGLTARAESVQLTPEEYAQGVRDMPSGVKDKLQEMGEEIRKAFVSISEVATTPPAKHEPGTAPLCTCGHHSDQHLAVTLPEGDFVLPCELCDCERYTPNTTEVDGWSEPDARGARFRVARFEQASHTPSVYFKVTDQLGKRPPGVFHTEAGAQGYAETLNRATSIGTDASVETEAQPESPAMALVKAMHTAVISLGPPSGFVAPGEASRVATIAVLRALAPMMRDDVGAAGIREMANELEQHTDTPATE